MTRQHAILSKRTITIVVCAVAFAALGSYYIFNSHAATPIVAAEVENGTVTSPANSFNDTTASGGKAVEFGLNAVPPPTSTGTPLLGVYDGGTSSDDAAKTTFGRYSDLSSSYYQPNQQALNVSAEEARVNKGIRPVITLTAKGTTYLTDISNKSGTGWTWLQTYVSSLASISAYAKTKGLPVYATLDHEFEVKVNQGVITGADANDAVYAKALSNFFALCGSNAPDVTTLYWFGGSDTADIGPIGAGLTVKPDMYTIDPYSTSGASGTATFEQIVKPKVDWLKAQSWYTASPKPYGLSEFGALHSDSQMATYFYPDLRTHLANLGLQFGIFFNRSVSPDVVEITTGYPLSQAAMAKSLAAQ